MIINILYIKKHILLILIFISLCFSITLQGQQLRYYPNEKILLSKRSLDSTLVVLKKHHKEVLEKKDTHQIAKTLISISELERVKLDFSAAFNTAGEALFLAKEKGDHFLIAKAHEELGILSYLYKQDNEAGNNFTKAKQYYTICYRQGKIGLQNLYQAYYNELLYYQRIRNNELLKSYIDSCYTIGKKAYKNGLFTAYLDEKKSSILERENKMDEAIQLLQNAAKTIEKLDPKSSTAKINNSFLIIVYGRIGNLYNKLQQYDLAKTYFEKSVEIDDVTGENTFYKSFVYSNYSELLAKQGDYKGAFQNQQKANQINYTYLNPRNDENQGFLTVKNQYWNQLNKKNSLIAKQNLELAQRNQELLRFRILFIVTAFIIISFGFVIHSRIKFLKHQKREQNTKELLDIKNNELTISTLQLIEKEKVVTSLRDYIKKSDASSNAKPFLKAIENRTESLWDAFNNRFISQNEGFYERLQKQVPNLSAADLKICALIKLNFSGKEMAYLLGISLGSVHVARHRLRQKMNLSRDTNLTNFINSI